MRVSCRGWSGKAARQCQDSGRISRIPITLRRRGQPHPKAFAGVPMFLPTALAPAEVRILSRSAGRMNNFDDTERSLLDQ